MTEAKQYVFVKGFYFRDSENVIKHREHFKRSYALKPTHFANSPQIHVEKNYRDKIVVGVHIRKGDYQTYKNGIYYYQNEHYLQWMNELDGKLTQKHNKEIIFILFSNEPITFTIPSNALVSENEWFIDQHIMTKCNYLIGAPSTFTLWSSYIGEVPLRHMYTSDASLSLDKFKISNATNSLDQVD